MWDFSSPNGDQTCVPCIAKRILNHWVTRDVEILESLLLPLHPLLLPSHNSLNTRPTLPSLAWCSSPWSPQGIVVSLTPFCPLLLHPLSALMLPTARSLHWTLTPQLSQPCLSQTLLPRRQSYQPCYMTFRPCTPRTPCNDFSLSLTLAP